jgi:ribosomal protein S18 acetylase RimI-like enzyme
MKTELLTAADTLNRLDELASLLIEAVEQGASIGFTLPLGRAEAGDYWKKIAGEVAAGNKALVVAWDEQGELLGSAQLARESRANGRHRAEVQKVMVRQALRGRGIGTELMKRIEQEARAAGRTLLFLDTSMGPGGAVIFYRRLGYNFVGSIPDYAADPDGRLVPNAIFYKQLV